MCEIDLGIDTFSYYYPLTPKQKSKIFERLSAKKEVRTERSDYESGTYIYFSNCFKNDGIKIQIHRIKGNPWGMVIVVHPLLVLGNSDRFSLYQPEKKSDYKKIVKRVDALLETIAVPCSIDKMKFFRIDITANLMFEDDTSVMEYLRILKKSYLLPHYRLNWFREKEHKARDCKIANEHSFKEYCKSAAFFSYDKTAQLEMIDAFPSDLIGKRVLRLEVQLRRKGLKKWIGKDGLDESNWSILKNMWKSSAKILHWYIKRLQSTSMQYVQYKEAVHMVGTIKGQKNRKRMLYLLKKTSDSNSLTTALEKMREEYSMSKGQQRTILKKFEKLGISPITLKNSSRYERLPSLKSLL